MRRITASVEMRAEALHDDPEVIRAMARRACIENLARGGYGPRGGRYVGVGEVEFTEDPMERFLSNSVMLHARQAARYVRPKRSR